MLPRPIKTGVVTFGLVSIPIRVYTAVSPKSIGFNMLHEKCKNRVKQRYQCPVCDVEVPRSDTVKGYEFAKEQYVVVDDDELEALEKAASPAIEIVEFVPLAKVDPIFYEDPHYLGPDKGGDRPYRLLVEALRRSERAAIARTVSHGKEHVVLIRPCDDGLVMHDLYRDEEVRDMAEIPKGEAGEEPKKGEVDLALKLVDHLASETFDPKKYPDTYREKLEGLIEEKVRGQEVVIAPAVEPRAQIIDIMEALKASLSGEAAAPAGVAARPDGGGAEDEAEEEEAEEAGAKKRRRKKKAG